MCISMSTLPIPCDSRKSAIWWGRGAHFMRTENCNASKLVFESHKTVVNPDSLVFTHPKIK